MERYQIHFAASSSGPAILEATKSSAGSDRDYVPDTRGDAAKVYRFLTMHLPGATMEQLRGKINK